MSIETMLAANLGELLGVAEATRALGPAVAQAAALIEACLLAEPRGKVLACGNGGGACDAAHFTAEIAGRYQIERRGFPAIDLTADHSVLTALVNDYPAEEVFARQVEALGTFGDVLAVFSASGDSANVRLALEAARSEGLKTVAFLGAGGGACKGLADVELVVPSGVAARVQEVHRLLYHTICEYLDPRLLKASDSLDVFLRQAPTDSG